MVGRWICNPEVPGSNPPPWHWMDLSAVAPNSTPTSGYCIVFVCNAHLIIFTWNLRDIYYNYYYDDDDVTAESSSEETRITN